MRTVQVVPRTLAVGAVAGTVIGLLLFALQLRYTVVPHSISNLIILASLTPILAWPCLRMEAYVPKPVSGTIAAFVLTAIAAALFNKGNSQRPLPNAGKSPSMHGTASTEFAQNTRDDDDLQKVRANSIINQLTPQNLRVISQEPALDNGDGTFTYRETIEISGDSSPNELLVLASGGGVKALELVAIGESADGYRSWRSGEWIITSLSNPHGHYRISVTNTQPQEQPQVQFKFEHN